MMRSSLTVGLPAYTFMKRGAGLHTGLVSKVMVKASRPRSGVCFFRPDTPGSVGMPGSYQHIQRTHRCTTLGYSSVDISTVEHLMAALYTAGAWDVDVYVYGPEVPILDGSIGPWLEALKESELYRQGGGSDRYFELLDVFEMEAEGQGGWTIRIEPAKEASLHLTIDFPNPGVGKQSIELPLTQEAIVEELANARTFGFRSELEKLNEIYMIRGASLERAVLFEDDGSVANPEGLRYPNEPVRHKALDLIGDFALLGAPLKAKITAFATGHTAHRSIMWALHEQDYLKFVRD